MKRFVMFALLSAATGLSSSASIARSESASFSCAHARSPDEIAICRSPALRRLDQRMAGMYQDILGCSGMGSRDVYREEQRDWLKQRQTCGSDKQCLTRLYDRWIAAHANRAAKSHRFLPRGECPF